MSLGLFVVRIVFGTLMVAHGTQKLLGWFGGYGIVATAAFFEGLGFRPGRLFVIATASTECASGVLLVIGLFEPAAAAAVMSVMLVAIATVHWGHGLLANTNGVEIPLLYATAAFCLAVAGPGVYSVDAALGMTTWWTPVSTSVVVVAGAIGAVAAVGMRRNDAAVAHA